MIELPKNYVAAAVDKKISKMIMKYGVDQHRLKVRWLKFLSLFAVIYSLAVSADSSVSVAEIRCLSDHQDQIRALININGQSEGLLKLSMTAFDY